ncbi:ABC1 kinase family protein [Marinivivus vitaminiproducens]|uniref:ABC1 kinase family protein n=1 Tax=Marinivivus vitaminiproducens TaxID=3035935 RepID=UPI002799D558|nr:AarF/UbiB family protein [Geminicoccaceae bacterium SCSIO 64248]
MNVVAFDRQASAGLSSRKRTGIRPKVVRRVVILPGASRMRQPEREPTALTIPSEQKGVAIVDSPFSDHSSVFLVAGAFIRVFFKLLWLRIKGEGSPARTGRELRAVFERLGGLWMKVGQLMSLRRDALPTELCDELAQLQHRALGFSPEVAMQVVERELGASIDSVFAAFDPMPFAAASLSQVHAARLRKGNKDVVVKVLRPGVRERFVRDMRLLRFVAKRLNRLPSLRRLRLQDAMGEFEEIFREETDYRYEISNMKELRRTTRGHKIYIPHVYGDLSTSNIIVMERIAGVLMSDYIRIREEDPERVNRWLEANNIKPKLVGKRLLISFMRQLFENNLFHADLHPGNIILLRDSRIALIDLGSVGSLDREFLTLYRGLQRALADNDFGKAADLQLRLCVQLPSRNMRELRSDLIRSLRVWSNKTKIPHLPFAERSVNNGAAEVSRILYRYGAQQTWEFLKIARTLSTLDGSLSYLHKDLNYIKILQEYFKKATRRVIMASIKPQAIASRLGQMAATIDEYHLMLGPVMRASAFNFEATVSKVSRIFALVIKVTSFIVAISLIGVMYRFTFHDHTLNGTDDYTLLDTIVDDLPNLEYGWWVILIVTGCFLLLVASRIVRELLQPEPNSRRRSQ